MHFCMYLFYNLSATLHVSNDYFLHHQEFTNLLYLQLCTNHANLPNCSVVLVIKTNHFLLYGANITICSQINTKHINTVWAERTVVECYTVGASRNL